MKRQLMVIAMVLCFTVPALAGPEQPIPKEGTCPPAGTPQSQVCKVTIECPPAKPGEPQVCKATFDCPAPKKAKGKKVKKQED
jgi:hypothetical protein